MRLSTVLASAAALAVGAYAADIPVQVGQSGDAYSPLSVTAAAGDTILFQFHEDEHNVVQSAGTSVADACTPMMGGFATQIMSSGTTYSLPINSTDPVYIHCGPHCKSAGMVFVVNPPSAAAVTDFQNAAEGKATTSSSSAAAGASSSAAPAASSSAAAAPSNGAISVSNSNLAPVAALAVAALMGLVAVM